MFTCPQCSLQIDDGFAPLPSKCPQCGTATKGGGAPPPPTGNFGAPADKTKTIFGMPPALKGPPGAPPPPPRNAPRPPLPGSAAASADLPAPAVDRNRPAELDLPAPAGFDMPAAELDAGGLSLDLPTPSTGSTQMGHAGFDLPAPASAAGGLELDLPVPAGGGGGAGAGFDLPAPARGTADLQLPSPPTGLDDLDLPAPAEDLPTPAEYLPTPAADLAPQGFEGLQLDIDRVGGEAPVPEAMPGFGGEYAAGAGAVPEVGTGDEPNANLVDAVDAVDAVDDPPSETLEDEGHTQDQPTPSTPGRQLTSEDVTNHRASPAPKQLPVFTRKRVLIGGAIAVLLIGGGGGAYMLGLFDGTPEVVVDRGAGTTPKVKPSGPAVERAAAILARFDDDTPQSYQQSQALLESQGDRVGQAEAELRLHLRYGPDPVLVGKAQGLLEGYENQQEPFVGRVRGLLTLAQGNPTAALSQLAGADPNAALYRSWASLELRDPKTALADAELALVGRPKSVAASLAKAQARAALEPEGMALLDAAYEAHPDHPRVRFVYAQALLDAGQLAKAEEVATVFESAPSPVPAFQATTLQLRARISNAQGNAAQALRLLAQAKELNPSDLNAPLQRVAILLATGETSVARSEADILLRDNPGLFKAGLITAQVAIAQGEGDAALARLDALGAGAQNLGVVARTRGEVFSLRMRVDEARAEFAKARASDIYDPQSTAGEAKMLSRANQHEEALKVIDEHLTALSDKSDNPNAQLSATSHLMRARARVLNQSGDLQGAKAELQKALEANPADNAVWLDLARTQLSLGEREAAEASFLKLAERAGSYPGLTGPLGRIYLRRGKLEDLEALLGDRLLDESASDEVTITGALLRLRQDRDEDAMKLVDRVLVRNPASWEGHLARGRVLFARGEFDGALIEFEQARPIEANSDVEFWLGRALESSGEESKATLRFRAAVELEPGNVLAAAHLGRRYAMGGQTREAIKMLEPLVQETEEFPFAFAVLGRAYYDLGDRKRALIALRKARRLDPKSFEAAYWEGRIEGDSNNHSAAARALQAAVKVAPDSGPQVQDAWRRLGRAHKTLGHKKAAKDALNQYLEIAPANATGRSEANRLLRDL